MKIGLIGLQNSGKTTIFNALTGLNIEIADYPSQKSEPNHGIVKVEDERVEKLSEIYNPKKTIFATIEYIDFVGISGDKSNSDSFSDSGMALVKTADALALVIRNYRDPITDDAPTPALDVEAIESDLLISDLIIAEKRLEKVELNKKRGIKDSKVQLEENVLKKVISHMENSLPIRSLSLSDDESKLIRGFQFITQKPLMIILNSDENKFGSSEVCVQELQKNYQVIEFAGAFEMELTKLEKQEAVEFMQDINIKESARDRLTKFSYELLGYCSFFTVGEDEVRAWTITKGENAVQAAGKIHSDLARGFIRAECFSYNDLINYGSEKNIKEKGLFRLEGKKYIVQDGDIISIRFSV
ncbi:MAG: redox-regulated ATPase YchF [Candidatus Cloacimonetes bacterium]|nr:redox-regulated ATPase YchF [Candidatus Cloacimonadota bacterium]